jgi:hypothetical protein
MINEYDPYALDKTKSAYPDLLDALRLSYVVCVQRVINYNIPV